MKKYKKQIGGFILSEYTFKEVYLYGSIYAGNEKLVFLFTYPEIFQAMFEMGYVDLVGEPFRNDHCDHVANILIEKQKANGELETEEVQVYTEDYVRENATCSAEDPNRLDKIIAFMYEDSAWNKSFLTTKKAAEKAA